MTVAASAVAAAVPNARVKILEGHTHDIDPSVLGPILNGFLS
jgi:hypothetical protein